MTPAPRLSDDTPGETSGTVAGDDSFLPTDVPLTVAAVAARLGVAPSTLRTWDRRYGLGPSDRAAGSHRRYTPEDVARLETMRRLTLAGAAPSDAARLAAPGSHAAAAPGGAHDSAGPVLVDDLTLAAAAVDGADARLQAMLTAAVRSRGLLRAWLEVAQPAFGYLAGREPGDRAGRDPVTLLAGAVLAAARAVAEAPMPDGDVPRPRVALLSDVGVTERLAAHVLAAALGQLGVFARVVAREVDLATLLRVVENAPASAICVIGRPVGGDQIAREASEEGRTPVFLVGPDSPEVWLPGVVRIRTLPGAVHEIADLLRADAGGDARGGRDGT